MSLEEIRCSFEHKLQELGIERCTVDCQLMANESVIYMSAYFNVGSKNRSKPHYKTMYNKTIDRHYTAKLERIFVKSDSIESILNDHLWMYTSINKKANGNMHSFIPDIIKNERCKV